MARRGDVVDAFGYNASSRAQPSGPWKRRHGEWVEYTALILKLSGVSVGTEPRKRGERARSADAPARPNAESAGPASAPLREPFPDMEYTDPRMTERR